MIPLTSCCRPDLAPDELLSSYLVRMANRLGISAYNLQRRLGDQFEIWTRDVDRSASSKLIDAIARFCDIDSARIYAMTLLEYEAALRQPISPKKSAGVATWINAIGVYHRERMLYGLQYCPECLKEMPAYKRLWRLSFVTACEEHSCGLRDGCPHCASPVAPHRSKLSISHCSSCSKNLVTGMADQYAVKERVTLQNCFLNAVRGSSLMLGKFEIAPADFVNGTSQIVRVAKSKLARVASDDMYGTRQIELMRTAERASYMVMLSHLLENWPSNFVEFCGENHVCQTSFTRYEYVPDWLEDIVRKFPIGIRRHRSSSSDRTSFQCSSKGAATNWRTKRARTLLRAAGVSA